ncbi:MAG TPA: hypothetical protein VIS73_09695 [Rhodocyclaceae bacterium]
MEVIHKITGQIASVGLPLFAVTLTAVPCANTPVLLILHWHGFRRSGDSGEAAEPPVSVPGSALQLNERWDEMARLDEAMLDAAWQCGAWELDREERRACNTVGADEREAAACLQAFGEPPLAGTSETLVADAPDQREMLRLGAAVGYVRWQFRPVRGGLWGPSPEDCSLAADGSRDPPCPVKPLATVGPRVSRTRYQLGRCDRILLP